MILRDLPQFKPLNAGAYGARAASLIPAHVVLPLYPGAQVCNVFETGGCADSRMWRFAKLDGRHAFATLEDAQAAAEASGAYLARRGDHAVVIARGGLFDPAPRLSLAKAPAPPRSRTPRAPVCRIAIPARA